MIFVKKTRYLVFKNLKFRCALGKSGIKKKLKKEILLAFACEEALNCRLYF